MPDGSPNSKVSLAAEAQVQERRVRGEDNDGIRSHWAVKAIL